MPTSTKFNYLRFFQNALNDTHQQGRYRRFTTLSRNVKSFPYVQMRTQQNTEKNVIVWCGNDYLGLNMHPRVREAQIHAIRHMGGGAGGTRNISGSSHLHMHLEKELANWHSTEAALVFTSGYVANEATLHALGAHLPFCVFLSDAHNHASIIQGMRLSRAERRIFKHNDMSHLRMHLEELSHCSAKVIVCESIYSMDGDISPLCDLVELAHQHHALLYIDEVHAVGLYGTRGSGLFESAGLSASDNIILQGTFGKALGGLGGYIASSFHLIEFIRLHAPGFIFTTSLPPATLAGNLASVQLAPHLSKQRQHIQLMAQELRQQLQFRHLPVHIQDEGHIVPFIVENAEICQQMSDYLCEKHHIYVQPINAPSVPPGTERFRLTPSAYHTRDMVQKLADALHDAWNVFHPNCNI